ncbi:M42 family metallopeptidase [Halorubrum sp. AJ67]|uniref:M42 family metallopeptidase n=1 Tax=Halorubrum sp. AJ67 TaxID=1173487 RepID=UPI0003DD91BB|nr:M42 family peptidase [Halorubrum sp. AJ67]CDK39616.1 cellulase [Halorubrum sp. AJ67]
MTANATFDFDLLARLTDAPGPVGYEDRVRDVVRDELPAVDAVRSDAMGNVVATVEGSADPDYEVLVAAHMDEIGLIVSHVDDDGFLSVEPLGGWNPDALRGHPVTVHTRDGDYDGVVGINAAHTAAEEAPEEWTLDDAYVFTGLDPDEATEAFGVGDVVTFDSDLREMGECVSGSALDDRAGVYAMLEAARLADPDVTVHYAATVQEEVGLRGAAALRVDVDPDLVVALDGTLEQSYPGVDPSNAITTLGDGVGIKRKDASVIPTAEVVERFESVAETRDIAFQREVSWNIGTDTAALQNAGGARPVGALSIPVRYHHSAVETADARDVEAAVDLLTAFLDSEDGTDYAPD